MDIDKLDIDSFLHKTPTDLDPKAGNLLIAAPMMLDRNFFRSVILILDREDNGGHLGLILNHKLSATVDALVADWKGTERMPLYNGGPVELDRLFMLHRLGTIIDGSIELLPGIYTGGDADQLRDYIASGAETEGMIRFFFGYSGWGPEQLTKEIIEQTWAVNTAPDPTDLLRGSGEEYWRREVERMGPDYRSWLSIPAHPSLN